MTHSPRISIHIPLKVLKPVTAPRRPGQCSSRKRLISPYVLGCEPGDANNGAGGLGSDNGNSVQGTSTKDYPLDVPSPLLLGGAMILSIIGVGTLFTSLTATTASSALEQAGTAAVVAINIPVSFYLFIAAIKKGQAETEEDDKRLGP